MSFTSAVLSGTIKKDAQQKFTPNNNSITSFTMDILRYDGRAKEEKSYPVKVNMWGESFAEMAPRLKQGTRVVVTGRLQIEQFTDKSGKNVRVLCIEANKVSELSEIASASAGPSSSANFDEEIFAGVSSNSTNSQTDAYGDQEVPF